MLDFMKQDFGNPSALYKLGIDAEKAVKAARRQVLAGADRDYEVVFTSGGTEADNMAIFGAAKALKRLGNRIVTTEVEHPAVLECCKSLEADGFEVVRIGVDEKCRLDVRQLEDAINDNTILVSIMHVNNEAGTVMPVSKVRSIMEKKKSPGYFHCDAVQSYGKLPLPGCADLISISGHKIHGPKGSGALLISKGHSASGGRINLPAYIVGGGQESGRRSGTENVPAIIGLGRAAEMSAIHAGSDDFASGNVAEIGRLREMLRRGIEDNIEDILINSPVEVGSGEGMCCPSILNVSFKKTRGEVILHTLEQDGIYVSTGSACSSNKKGQSHVLKAMGLKDKEIEGTIRFSLGRFNTQEDIEITVDKLADAVRRFRLLGSFR